MAYVNGLRLSREMGGARIPTQLCLLGLAAAFLPALWAFLFFMFSLCTLLMISSTKLSCGLRFI